MKEWERSGFITNDKNLSNWVIRVAEEWLFTIYEKMKNVLKTKSILDIDETYAKILMRSDGKPGQSKAYSWVFKSIPSRGPVIDIFHSALTRRRIVLEEFTKNFKSTVICDGYSAYDNTEHHIH